MNNVRYFKEFERGRRDFLYRIGIYNFYKKHNVNTVVNSITTRFRKSFTILQEFNINTKLIYVNERNIFIEQRIVKDSFIHCIAYVSMSVINKQTKKSISTNNFLQYFNIKKDDFILNDSLKYWIDHLKQSSNELRIESGFIQNK